jgi:hypothetical protein
LGGAEWASGPLWGGAGGAKIVDTSLIPSSSTLIVMSI